MRYFDAILVILYLVVLILIIVEFSGLWAIASALLLILIISSLQKTYFENLHKKMKEEKDDIFSKIADKLDVFSSGIETVRRQIEESSLDLESKLVEIQEFNSKETEKTYRDLTRKVVDIENKLSVVKRTLGAAYGVIDERLVKMEEVLNLRNEDE